METTNNKSTNSLKVKVILIIWLLFQFIVGFSSLFRLSYAHAHTAAAAITPLATHTRGLGLSGLGFRIIADEVEV